MTYNQLTEIRGVVFLEGMLNRGQLYNSDQSVNPLSNYATITNSGSGASQSCALNTNNFGYDCDHTFSHDVLKVSFDTADL